MTEAPDTGLADAAGDMTGPFDEITRMPGHLLRRCQQIAVSIFLRECRAFELTPLQYAILGALNHYGELDQNQLGGLTALDRTTVSTVLGNLEGRGLVLRRRSTTDRRYNFITCTDAGRRLLEAARASVEDVQQKILAPLDKAEQEQFIVFLQRVAEGNNGESRAPLRPRTVQAR